jgi:histidinol-phosphate phosphatase family protein
LPRPRAVFLDRDGVLTRDKPGYVKSVDELELLPGISSPLKALQDRGFLLIVVTNQSIIGRGLATDGELAAIHSELRSKLQKLGCKIDAIYFCPHRPEENCNCRKPGPGLLLSAADDFEIDLKDSWLIGDQDSDLEAARRVGCRGIKVQKNEGKLVDAVNFIISSKEFNREGAT